MSNFSKVKKISVSYEWRIEATEIRIQNLKSKVLPDPAALCIP